jgi:hypothetical protein
MGERWNIIGFTLSHPRKWNGSTIHQADRKSHLTVYGAYSSSKARTAMATKIQGIEGMRHGERSSCSAAQSSSFFSTAFP